MERFVGFCGLIFLGLLLTPNARSEDNARTTEAKLEFFEKEVRPVLAARCFECHSGAKEPKGGLKLDSRAAILQGGDTGPAYTAEKPLASLLISAINYGDLYQMPPKSKMPTREIEILTRWVQMGIPWPDEAPTQAGHVKPFDLASRLNEHWCWRPLKDSPLPSVSQSSWPINGIDRFVLSGLEKKGLKPAPAADRRQLLRRLYFDLIGLPPAPDEVEKFVNDSDPLALEKTVDLLLSSVHFGERWARHWMDVVRYAETRGHEFEPIIPNAWQYRDYVIRAFNRDVPYNRFLTEQIAGDLIEPRWRQAQDPSSPNESPLGTGFWFLGEEVHSPVDIRKDETDRIDNRIDVLSKAFLGLTVACARCHDHKFDAISQRDYYALAGYALSGSYRQLRVDTAEQHRAIAQRLAELRNHAAQSIALSIEKNSQPVLEKVDQYWLAAIAFLNKESTTTSGAKSDELIRRETEQAIHQLATANSLDPSFLTKWINELRTAKTDPIHPLYSLINFVKADLPPSVAELDPLPNPPDGLVVDFGNLPANFSFQDGVSFGLSPVTQGQLQIDGTLESPVLSVTTVGGWKRDLFWKNLKLSPGTEVDNGQLGKWESYGRMVRSPEFTLTSRQLWYLVRGSVRAYATVNSHLIIVGPLHNSLLREFKNADEEWHWVSHGLELYQGHRLHVEFSPMDDSNCTVAMVYQGEQPPALPARNWPRLENASRISSSREALAAYYKNGFKLGLDLLNRPTTEPGKSQNDLIDKSEAARLVDWLIKHQSLFSATIVSGPDRQFHDAESHLTTEVRWDSSLAPCMMEANGVDELLLVRGNSNTPKEPVPRRFLEAYQKLKAEPVSSNSRLQLAQEILQSPLASRVAVNRIWHHLFGAGLVPTVDNFGALGLPPSHPELLDHLALQFERENWSVKSLIRSLVLTRTYQMSSHPTEADLTDPKNELWHRMPVKRLEGEAIRDSLLAVSGRLDRTTYGHSVPIHLTEFMQGRGRPGASGPLDGNGRRSLYIAVRRNFLSPMMLAFDTPNPFSTVGRRTVSNVPAQALILMNDPFVIEQATRWSEQILADTSQSTDQRIHDVYLTAFGRPPTEDELAEANSFLQAQGANDPATVKDAWSHFCHVVINLKEFIFVE